MPLNRELPQSHAHFPQYNPVSLPIDSIMVTSRHPDDPPVLLRWRI